ncbi:MAG: TlpA family protein disulfide reductase, partial [Bacteroidia bacterium]|nr:TlpA family protein disulfide reductase [Bacteroidia bacterium]
MRYLMYFLVIFLFTSCAKEEHTTLMQGNYRALLEVQDGELLAFNFKVRNDSMIEIYNAEEVIVVDDIVYANDSIRINFPVYEGYIAGKFSDGKISDAQYIKESLDRYVPFKAEFDKSDRFDKGKTPEVDVGGIWEMLFTEDDGNTFIAKGIFKQEGHI